MDREQMQEVADKSWGFSQVQAIGEPAPRTWDDYERGCLATFSGGYRTDEQLAIFRHGMNTVFNLLRAEFHDAWDRKGKQWWMRVAEAKQEERDKALAEVERLKALNEALCERIAAAHEVIAKNAERRGQ